MDHRTTSQEASPNGHQKAESAAPMNKDQIIDAYWAGDMGDVEFAEIGLDLGMQAHEIAQVMSDVREEDGTL